MAAAARRSRASPAAGRLLRLALLLSAASRAGAQWVSTVFAGSTTTAGHADGLLTAAAQFSFFNGNGLAFAPNGTLYVADNPALRVVDPGSATVRTLVNGSAFTGVCTNAATGAVYAIDYGASPKQLVQLYSNGSKRVIATGYSALACAVDNSGFIIVANTYSCARARCARRLARSSPRARERHTHARC
jgi:hypothetical protein